MSDTKRLPDSSSKTRSILQIWKNKKRYQFNRAYQREPGAWSKEDKLYLIDSILRNVDLPKFYVRRLPDDIYEVVDGQQRLLTIWKFIEDKEFRLTEKVSGEGLAGINYEKLPENLRDHFEGYDLDLVILSDYDDEMVRELFSRLQRGKTLTPAEKLNAYPGEIVVSMREIAQHSFFRKFTFRLKRYRAYLIAARMMILTKYGVGDVGPNKLYEFFRSYRGMKSTSKEVKKVKRILNYLGRAFPEKTPELSNDSWILNLFILTSHLLKKYVIKDREKDLQEFYRSFWLEAEGLKKEKRKPSKYNIEQDFVLSMSSGTTGSDRIQIRLQTIEENFIENHRDLKLLDPNREFDRYEKAVIYKRDKGVCQRAGCEKHVKWSDYEADHVRAWIKGGETTVENGQVLCKIHNRQKGSSL